MSPTDLLERPTEMSVVERNFDTKEEVKPMTATTASATAFDRKITRRARPHGLDLAVMRLSLAMLLWARRHADRTTYSHDEQARRLQLEGELVRREHQTALMAARVL